MDKENDKVIPVVSEEVHVDAVPVQTGGVRVIKRVIGHDEVIEQDLKKDTVELQRIKMNRVVDGPLPIRQEGETIIVPVVEEVLKVEKSYVLVEEVHLARNQKTERHEQVVTVNREEVHLERFDAQGNSLASEPLPSDNVTIDVNPPQHPASTPQNLNPSKPRLHRRTILD
jgi:uncharacterized protein (TIGR02271 family)